MKYYVTASPVSGTPGERVADVKSVQIGIDLIRGMLPRKTSVAFYLWSKAVRGKNPQDIALHASASFSPETGAWRIECVGPAAKASNDRILASGVL